MLATGVGRGVAISGFLLRTPKLPIRPLTSVTPLTSPAAPSLAAVKVVSSESRNSSFFNNKATFKPAFSNFKSHQLVVSACHAATFSTLLSLPPRVPANLNSNVTGVSPQVQASRSMATFNQLVKRNHRSGKGKNKPRSPNLKGNPQKKGIVQKVFAMAPKKPNSASRKVVSVLLALKKRTEVHCHIPGVKHALQQFSTVLVRGGRAKDLPGVKYRLVRGKFDLKRVFDRFKARSKYGVKKNS